MAKQSLEAISSQIIGFLAQYLITGSFQLSSALMLHTGMFSISTLVSKFESKCTQNSFIKLHMHSYGKAYSLGL